MEGGFFRTAYNKVLKTVEGKIPIRIQEQVKIVYNVLFHPLFDVDEKRRYRQVYGGRGSGKSFVVALFAIITTLTKKRRKVLYLRQTMTSSEDSTYSDVKLVMETLGVESLYQERGGNFTCKLTGSQILFKGIRATGAQSAKLKSLSGVTDLIIEEAEEVESFEEFSKVDESIRMKGLDLTVTLVYNPTSSESSWIHEEWFEDGEPREDRVHDTVYIHSTYLDNLENLADSTIQRYEDLAESNPTYYINTILAQWTLEVTGRVYEGWRKVEELPILPPGQRYETWYGLDFMYGGKDKCGLVEVNYTEVLGGPKYFLRELLCKRYRKNGLMIEEMKLNFPELYSYKIIADSAAPTLVEDVKDAGFRRTVPVRKLKIEQGITKVQELDITIVGDSPHLFQAYNTWGRKKNGSLPHEPDILAASRYALMHRNTRGGRMTKPGSSVVRSSGYI